MPLAAGCDGKAGGQTAKPKGKPPAPVSVAMVIAKDVPKKITAIGNVDALTTVSISSQVEGTLEKAHFSEGQDIQKGALLFTIDPRPFEADLDGALADLSRDRALLVQYQRDASRGVQMAQRDFISRQDSEQLAAKAESQAAQVRADQAAVEAVRLKLSYTAIRSPISGRTGPLLVHPGNVVKADPNSPLVVIRRISPCYVRFSVSEKLLPEIQKAMAARALAVEAAIPNAGPAPEKGTLSFVDSTVDKDTGTVLFKGFFPNREARLWPGQFVDVSLFLAMIHGAVVAPARAIQEGPQGTFAYVVKPDKTVEARPVKPGDALGDEILVAQGLAPGEMVVTEGQMQLFPGAKVILPGARGQEARKGSTAR